MPLASTDRKPLAAAPARTAAPPLPVETSRRPRTIWANDAEWGRVQRLGRSRDWPAGLAGRKALMLGVSMLENGLVAEASTAGVGR